MADQNINAQGSLVSPADAGEGQEGVVSRWVMELDEASNREKGWRKRAGETVQRFRDESDKGKASKRGAATSRFNILWANTSILRPKLYSSTPRPDVRRRFKTKDPVGKRIASMVEHGLAYCADEHDVDQVYKLAVLDYLLPGRGMVRVRYHAEFEPIEQAPGMLDGYDEGEPDLPGVEPTDPTAGEPGQRKVYETTYPEHVAWARVRLGPADKWEDLPWLGIQHILTRAECIEAFGKEMGEKVPLEVNIRQADDATDDVNTHGEIFKLGLVWEIWDKSTRKVYWIAPSYEEGPISVEDDPLELEQFWPFPRPLYAVETSESLVPIEEYRLYRDQAEELDSITRRIQVIVKGLKVRGIYAATITELERLMSADDNTLIPSEAALAALQSGGLDRAIWMMPIQEMAQVLVYLYQQREQVKQVIYEITGLSDIMRGATDPNETLGAQQLKAQSGGLRISDRQREVQRFVRDVYRIQAEIMSEQFSPETWAIMTGTQPTEEMLQILRDDKSRGFRIDVETDSTVAVDQQREEENAAKAIEGIASYTQAMIPAVQSGMIPQEMVLKLLLPFVRRTKLGREVEDAIDQLIGEDDDQEQNTIKMSPEQFEQEKAMLEQQAMEQAQAQAEQAVAAEKAGIEAAKKQLDADMKTAQIDLKTTQMELAARESKVELAEKALGLDTKSAGQTLERRALDLGIKEAQMDAKAYELENQGEDVADGAQELNGASQTLQAVTDAISKLTEAVAQSVTIQGEQNDTVLAALSAPKEIIKDKAGRPVGVRTRLDG